MPHRGGRLSYFRLIAVLTMGPTSQVTSTCTARLGLQRGMASPNRQLLVGQALLRLSSSVDARAMSKTSGLQAHVTIRGGATPD
jgi:hypothetical protein